MVQIAEWAVVNSLTVLALAPLVWCISRICRWPSVRHTLWVVLLLKFITPPVVAVPTEMFRVHPFWPAAQSPTTSALRLDATKQVASFSAVAPIEALPTTPNFIESDLVNPQTIATAPADSFVLPKIDARRGEAAPLLSLHEHVVTSPAGAFPWQAAVRIGLLVWFAGSLMLFAIQSLRLLRFGRRLALHSSRCDLLNRETAAAADRMGLNRFPQARLVDGVVSPMLWGIGRWTRVLFPAELFEQLDAEARGTLLMHELAHYRRGDHWVRVLELAVTSMFWWHPVVWWAVREIESAEEDCCDAWVMQRSATSPRCYATALLDTIDFLCEKHPFAPPVASGLGNPTELRGRLVRIMTGTGHATQSPWMRGLAWSLIVFLPMQPAAFGSLTRALSLQDVLWRSSDSREKTLDPVETLSTPAETAALNSPSMNGLEKDLPSIDSAPRSKEWARAVSSDGRFHLIARTGGRIELHDLKSSRITDLTDRSIVSAAFIPGTRTFVTGGEDRQVRLWDAVSARPLRTLGEHSERVVTVAASADGTELATGSRDGMVSRWTIGPEIAREDLQLAAPVSCIRFSPDGSQLAIATGSWRASNSGSVVTFDLATGTVNRQTSLPAPVGAIGFVDDGRVLAAGAWDGTVHYLAAEDHRELLSVVSTKDAISAAGFSADTGVFPVLSLEQARAERDRERERLWREQQAQLQFVAPLTPSAPRVFETGIAQ